MYFIRVWAPCAHAIKRMAFAILHFKYALFRKLRKSTAGVLSSCAGLLPCQVADFAFRYPTVIVS
jgi:hypothetical protein